MPVEDEEASSAGLDSDPEIVLVTYQLLPNVIEVIKAWARRHRIHVALDESHRTKAGYSCRIRDRCFVLG